MSPTLPFPWRGISIFFGNPGRENPIGQKAKGKRQKEGNKCNEKMDKYGREWNPKEPSLVRPSIFFFFMLLFARSFDATFASATWLGGNGTQTHVRVELSELASTKHLNNYSKTSHMFLSFKLIDHCPAPLLFHWLPNVVKNCTLLGVGLRCRGSARTDWHH